MAAAAAVGCGSKQPPAPAGGAGSATAAAQAPAPAAAAPPPAASPASLPPAAPATPAGAAQAAPASNASAPAGSPLASQPYNQDPNVRCDVMEVRRVSGGALLVRWRLVYAAAPTSGLAGAAKASSPYVNWAWDNVYFTDPAENKKYQGLRDSSGAWLAQGEAKSYSPGDQQMMWMKFPAPPPTSSKITFVFAGFPPFEDLPVS